MALHQIKKGRDLRISGTPIAEIATAGSARQYALLPPDFHGRKFKLEVKEGDPVKAGSPIFADRENPAILYTSPAGGRVAEIRRGEQRRLLAVIVERDENEPWEDFGAEALEVIPALPRDHVLAKLLRSGLWPAFIQRPFQTIADPAALPKSIFVNAMDTEPNCADRTVLVAGKEKELRAGMAVLKVLCGKVFFCSDARSSCPCPQVAAECGAEAHQFSGPHPAGNSGTHIFTLDPLKKGEVVWQINLEQAVRIGELFLTGKLPVQCLVAVSGSAARDRRYFRTRAGAPLSSLVQGRVKEGTTRCLNGGVLSGTPVGVDGFLGFYTTTVTVLPEGGHRQLLGWLSPGFHKPSFHRIFAQSLLPSGPHSMNTGLNGERRALVLTHMYDDLITLDLPAVPLIKACIAKDVEAMEHFGILECAPEDFSLCAYACPSKVEWSAIIRQSLDLLRKEG